MYFIIKASFVFVCDCTVKIQGRVVFCNDATGMTKMDQGRLVGCSTAFAGEASRQRGSTNGPQTTAGNELHRQGKAIHLARGRTRYTVIGEEKLDFFLIKPDAHFFITIGEKTKSRNYTCWNDQIPVVMAKKIASHSKKKTVVKKSPNPSKPLPFLKEEKQARRVDSEERKDLRKGRRLREMASGEEEDETLTVHVTDKGATQKELTARITSNEEESLGGIEEEENIEEDSEEDVHIENFENYDENEDEEAEMEEESEKEGKEEEKSQARAESKRRCLVLCSRGVTARYRHLLEDIRNLLPHHKKDAKLDVGKAGYVGRAVNEIAELKSCNSVLFLECRKRADCYMWLSETPQGPSVKFHISNVHTMDELRLTGNCMKGSRPVLSFDESFGCIPHLQLLKVLLIKVFGTPKGHPKSKPFVDRVMAFYYADKKVRTLKKKNIDRLKSVQKSMIKKQIITAYL